MGDLSHFRNLLMNNNLSAVQGVIIHGTIRPILSIKCKKGEHDKTCPHNGI